MQEHTTSRQLMHPPLCRHTTFSSAIGNTFELRCAASDDRVGRQSLKPLLTTTISTNHFGLQHNTENPYGLIEKRRDLTLYEYRSHFFSVRQLGEALLKRTVTSSWVTLLLHHSDYVYRLFVFWVPVVRPHPSALDS